MNCRGAHCEDFPQRTALSKVEGFGVKNLTLTCNQVLPRLREWVASKDTCPN